MHQLDLFKHEIPNIDYMSYLAELVEIEKIPKSSEELFDLLMERITPRGEAAEKKIRSNGLDEYDNPDVLIFYLDHKGDLNA